MTNAAGVFFLAVFALALLSMEGAQILWDSRFGRRRRVLQRMAQWEEEPQPFEAPTLPLRTTDENASLAGLLWPSRLARQYRHRKALQVMASQLPDAFDFISRALRAGHDVTRAIELAGQELPQPLAGELRLAAEEIRFGAGLGESLRHLGTRVPLPDLNTFIVAASLHRETGGDVTRVFDHLSRMIRERAALRQQIRVASTEGRLSAWILTVLPAATALLVQWLHPGLLAILTQDPVGRWVLWGALVLWLGGILAMRSITRITL
jgi:tight adherence protein B